MSTALVKELRDKTGAGIMDCKRALEEAQGDVGRAAEILRQQGMAKAEKKAGRMARQGIIDAYIHSGGRIGALVELNCETDFVARTPDFQALAREIAMQVAAMNPQYVSVDDIPADERERLIAEHGDEKRFVEERVLLAQPYIRDQRRSIEQLVKDAIGKLGENIVVRRVARFEVGATSVDEPAGDE
jgi:elongation factor Ts